MDIERAIEILNPEHREHYDSIETVNEACRMGMEALRKLREAQEGDFISRDAAISWLEDMQCKHPRKADAFGAAKVHFKRLPAADVKPVVRSYWEKEPDGGYVCHECRNRPLLDGSEADALSDYCPNCGAKMEVQDG